MWFPFGLRGFADEQWDDYEPTTSRPGEGAFPGGGGGGGVFRPPQPQPGLPTAAGFFTQPGKIFPLPPENCVLARVAVPARVLQTVNPEELDDPTPLLDALDPMSRQTLGAALAKWAHDYPNAPPALLVHGVRMIGKTPNWSLAVVRPFTEYDPILDVLGAPVIQPGTQRAFLFEAGLRFFLPDFVIDPLGNALRVGGTLDTQGRMRAGTGSRTIYGPFPWRVKFVNEKMIELAVDVAKMPGAFRPDRGQDSGVGFMDIVGNAVGSAVKVGATTPGPAAPYAAAGAAIASTVIGAFEALFGGRDPQSPAWLVKLLAMKGLRGDTSPVGPPSFGQQQAGNIGLQQNPHQCRIAIIHAPPDGRYTVEEGYTEVIRRLGGAGGKKPPWWLIAVGVGAAVALGS